MLKVWVDGSTTDICYAFENGDYCIEPAIKGKTVTSNEGEYWAVIHALNGLRGSEYKELTILSDSELMVNQLNNKYKVEAENLYLLWKKVKSLVRHFQQVEFQWIPREENKAGILLEKRKN